jgi:two-component system KDP operon response regulator KdpE
VNGRILVVDDEPQMGRLLATSLRARDYDVLVVGDGNVALDEATRWKPDLILLDLGLPGIDGLEVCRRVRSWSDVPIIVVSARESEAEKVAVLDLGADDYLTKPFGTDELLARIRVALRHRARGGLPGEPTLRFGELELDLAHRITRVRGQQIHLTPTEYDLLKVLATQAGKVLTHQMLVRSVWGGSYQQDVATLRVFITQLRRKIEADPAHPRFITTEPGIGYRFRIDS